MPAGLLGSPAGDGFRMCPGMWEMVFRMFTGSAPATMAGGTGDAPRTEATTMAGDGPKWTGCAWT